MNVFAVFERPDGSNRLSYLLPGRSVRMFGARNCSSISPVALAELDVVTPPLDRTILPGVTRASVLALLSYHPLTTALPQLSGGHAHAHRRACADPVGALCCVGTAAVVILAARIGWQLPRPDASASTETKVVEMVLPPPGGLARKPRAGTLGAPRGYSGGACRVGVVGRPEPLMLDAGACKWTAPVT